MFHKPLFTASAMHVAFMCRQSRASWMLMSAACLAALSPGRTQSKESRPFRRIEAETHIVSQAHGYLLHMTLLLTPAI